LEGWLLRSGQGLAAAGGLEALSVDRSAARRIEDNGILTLNPLRSELGRYVLRRLLMMIPLTLGITAILFALIQLAPCGPECMLFQSGRSVDESLIEAYRVKIGTDQPVLVQYVNWVQAALTGDFGVSYSSNRPAATMVASRLPATVELMGLSLLVALVLAIALGTASAVWQGRAVDHLGTGFSYFGIAMPVFWFGLILQLVFGVWLGWLPVSQRQTIGSTGFLDRVAHLILPTTVLALHYVAQWSRYLRSDLIEVLQSDFIRTARAKGLSERRVVGVHALRNALGSTTQIVALSMASMFTGAVITETVFGWPGIGLLFVQSMTSRDYPVLMAILVMGSVAVLVFNLVADIAKALLDPRVRLE